MDFDWKINGGHKQESREGYNLLDFNVTQGNKVTYNEDGSITINGVGAFSLKFNQITLEANKTYKQKMQLISGTIKDSSGKDMKDSAIMSFSSDVWLNTTKSSTYSKAEETSKSSTWVHQDAIFDNAKIKIWAYEGTEEKPYEQYGASPSPDYPSEVETVNGSVEIDVVNKNFLNIANTEETTKGGITYSIKNGILKLNGTATANFDIQLSENIKIKKGKYIHSSNYIQSGLYISFDNLGYTMISATVGKKKKIEITEDTIYKRYFIWIDKGTVLNNVEIKLQLEVGDTATDFVEHQSQTAIMPIQQEMLEGDYIKDVEHHEWEKIIIDTSKLIENVTNEEGKKRYEYEYDKNIKESDITHNVAYSNMFKLLGGTQTFFNVKGFTIVNNTIYIYDEGESLTEFKSKITDKQLVFYAQLETSINLELTEEQKAVRQQKLYTYKNITNISLSDELASIDVDYKKDLETEHNKLQNEIDEIKQLISTTETSALLLDNLQKDVESEVE